MSMDYRLATRTPGAQAAVLEPSDLDRRQQEAEADDPGPVSDAAGDADVSEMCEQGDDLENETDEPGDLFGCFSGASGHDCVLRSAATLLYFVSTTWVALSEEANSVHL